MYLETTFKLCSFTVFNWCFISLKLSVVRATSSSNLTSGSFSPSPFDWYLFIFKSGQFVVICLTDSSSPGITTSLIRLNMPIA